ncbi:hypothetical protein [Psychrobacillus sp. L3]|uniref:hypothetical protein n=1 Tax=Psychrobacillus sp. L3 TaxID=3236891 RepID=UPI0036F35A10
MEDYSILYDKKIKEAQERGLVGSEKRLKKWKEEGRKIKITKLSNGQKVTEIGEINVKRLVEVALELIKEG